MIVYEQVNSRGWCEWADYLVRGRAKRKGGRPIDRDYCDKIIQQLESFPESVMPQYLMKAMGDSRTGSSTRNIIQTLTYYELRLFESDDGRVGLLGVHDD